MGSCQSAPEENLKGPASSSASSSTTTTIATAMKTKVKLPPPSPPPSNGTHSHSNTDTATRQEEPKGEAIVTVAAAAAVEIHVGKNHYQKQESNGSEEGEKSLGTNHNEIDSAVSNLNSKVSSVESRGVTHDDTSEVSSIGSGSRSGSGMTGDCSLRRSQRKLSTSHHRSKRSLGNSSSVIGLDSMIESRREEGALTSNVVHMEVPFGKPIEEVYDGIHTGPVLGSGISGVVRLVTHHATGVKYAVKCLDLGLVDTEEGLMQLREEIFIMCELDHPNIVRLEEVYESHSEIYLVQELCVGGELFDRLDEQPDYHYTEAECAHLIKQMLCAVRYLHSKGIIHRDLKLENFLFSSSAEDSELKMIDFGLSKHFRYGEVHQEAVGTPYTVAPEVIRGRYDERCDIWAIGVISFLLLSGDPPFGGCSGSESLLTVRTNILNGSFEFEPAEVWDLVSPTAKEFINTLLVTNPKLRPTATEAQKLTWLEEWAHRTKSDNDQILNPNVVRALVNFKEFSYMRKLLCEVLSFTLLPEQIKDLRKEFETLDIDGSGEISLLSLKQVLVTNAGAGSLGALTEEEVEDIFNAMRVKKSETRIRWHEFIAAGLSQCEVDDRNLRLAFDRLDNDHKGYVTLDDIMEMLGSDALHSEEALKKMWVDSMKDCNCNSARIAYEDFVRIMKGQTRDFEADGSRGKLPHTLDAAKIELGEIGESSEATLKNRNSPIVLSIPAEESPLSIDNNNAMTLSLQFPMIPTFTPPTPPPKNKLSTNDPRSEPKLNTLSSDRHIHDTNIAPNIPKPSVIHVRVKSRSLDESHMKYSFDECVPLGSCNSVSPSDAKALSALQVNRKLYRSHRQMSRSVIDACKRFEEQQTRHAHDVILKEKSKANSSTAGLVMRRVGNKTVPTEEIKTLLEKNRKEQEDLMEKANRRGGGRGRSGRRKKTVSDLSAMMGSLSSEDMTRISIQASNKPIKIEPSKNKLPPIPPVIETKSFDELPQIDTNLRSATVPGEFRRVNDPFASHGIYATMITSEK